MQTVIIHQIGEEMKKSRTIKQFDIERSTQAKWSDIGTMLNIWSASILALGTLSVHFVPPARDKHTYKSLQNLKLSIAIFSPWVVYKEMKEWGAKKRDAFGIDATSRVKWRFISCTETCHQWKRRHLYHRVLSQRKGKARVRCGWMITGESKMKRTRCISLSGEIVFCGGCIHEDVNVIPSDERK